MISNQDTTVAGGKLAVESAGGARGAHDPNLRSGGLAHDRLRTVGAAPRIDGDFAQAFRTLLGSRIGRGRVLAATSDQSVDRGHHEEVNRGGDQKEADHSRNKITDRKHRTANREANPGKIRLTA